VAEPVALAPDGVDVEEVAVVWVPVPAAEPTASGR
jgi:hypothetical protein